MGLCHQACLLRLAGVMHYKKLMMSFVLGGSASLRITDLLSCCKRKAFTVCVCAVVLIYVVLKNNNNVTHHVWF